jgi:hypothetical protein
LILALEREEERSQESRRAVHSPLGDIHLGAQGVGGLAAQRQRVRQNHGSPRRSWSEISPAMIVAVTIHF